MEIPINPETARGMDLSIPLRLCLSGEVPRVRAFWFEMKTSPYKTPEELFVELLERNDIPYAEINHQVWFFWQGHWCRYEYLVDEEWEEIKYYLLCFRTIHP